MLFSSGGLLLAGLSALPVETPEAGRVDGADGRKLFFRIIVPQLKPTLYTVTVLSFINSFRGCCPGTWFWIGFL